MTVTMMRALHSIEVEEALMDIRLHTPAVALRLALGLMATLAGLDKFINILADWSSYVSPLAAQILPVPLDLLMVTVGVTEMAVGIAILTAWPVVGAYAASAWLAVVTANLLVAGYYDIAVRDAVLSLAAFTLARLTLVQREPASLRRVEPEGAASKIPG